MAPQTFHLWCTYFIKIYMNTWLLFMADGPSCSTIPNGQESSYLDFIREEIAQWTGPHRIWLLFMYILFLCLQRRHKLKLSCMLSQWQTSWCSFFISFHCYATTSWSCTSLPHDNVHKRSWSPKKTDQCQKN